MIWGYHYFRKHPKGTGRVVSEIAWVTCAARFHRIARLWTSNEDQEAAVMAQSVVEVIRFLGGFFTGPGSSGMTGFEGVDDLERARNQPDWSKQLWWIFRGNLCYALYFCYQVQISTSEQIVLVLELLKSRIELNKNSFKISKTRSHFALSQMCESFKPSCEHGVHLRAGLDSASKYSLGEGQRG